MFATETKTKLKIMERSTLQKGLELCKKIESKKTELKNKEYALNCLNNETSKSAFIKLSALSGSGSVINDDKAKHYFEIGTLIFIFEESIVYLNDEILELEYEFKKL